MGIGDFVMDILGSDLPIRLEAWDGSAAGPADAPSKLLLRSPKVAARLVRAPNAQLGLGRAFVAGDLDFEGDLYQVLELRNRIDELKIGPRHWWRAFRHIGPSGLRKLPPPPEEIRLHGARHSKRRDAAAISHHYDVSNEFYALVLGPSMTYSCAVWTDSSISLEKAQENKYELICRKLHLHPDQRLLDVGCGWGSMLIHAAQHHGVQGVGVTLSSRQAELARKRVAEAGLESQIEIRVQDYREIDDGPYDAISSIGMFEHVGLERLGTYFTCLHDLLAPGGRLLNHGIASPDDDPNLGEDSFANRYVFPDGALPEIGAVVSELHRNAFEVRHVESLREHYALTLRQWVRNLEASWAEAVAQVGSGRARVWLLYMAASAIQFETNRTQVYQALAVRPTQGQSGMPLRPHFEANEPPSE